MKYKFYYDETEHSRKINEATIAASNFYENFISVIVGWKENKEAQLAERYKAFEKKYCSDNAELKSTALRQEQFINGFASLNKHNEDIVRDFLGLFDEDIYIYMCCSNKVEYIVSQLFIDYKNNLFEDMDAFRYTITKALLTYRPKNVFDVIYNKPDRIIEELRIFFQERIKANKTNMALKSREIRAFEDALSVLDQVQPIKTTDWNYSPAFIGFSLYLKSKHIENYDLIIDKEKKTAETAINCGLKNTSEQDSKNTFGIRMADMLSGIIAKIMKSLNTALTSKDESEFVTKHILCKSWFKFGDSKLALYKKLHYVLIDCQNDWYKVYAGNSSDDLVCIIALLKFMDAFESSEQIQKNLEMQGEYFNSYLLDCLDEHFVRMKNKLPIEPIDDLGKDYFLNRRMSKVYYDVSKQPYLYISEGTVIYYVLSVGFNNAGIPFVTIQECNKVFCYRLPDDYSNWAMTVIGMANKGTNLFPSNVVFSKKNNKYYADIL